MFNRHLLVISIVLAGCSLTTNSFAQDAQRGDGARGKPPRGEFRDIRGPGRQSQDRILGRIDTNGDTPISLEEFTAKGTANYEHQFERADRNDDGLISKDELHPTRRGPAADIDVAALRECIADEGGLPEVEEDRFAIADKDGDGALSQEEFFLQLEQRAYDQFARMDKNEDGQLSSAELGANMEGRNEQRRIVRECMAEQVNPFL